MTVTTIDDEVIAIVRVYSGDKWCKVIREDGNVEWVKTTTIEEKEV